MAKEPEDRSKLSGGRTYSETLNYETMLAEAAGDAYPFFEHPAYDFSRKTFWEDDNAGNYNKPFPPE